MCVTEGNLVWACETHLREGIAKAFAEFPELAEVKTDGDCDDWAFAEDVAHIYAKRIHAAWDRVREARYLLGEDA